jgi:hypothetical protein
VPPFHTIVFPALVPVKVALVELQLILLLLTAVTVGGVVFDVTATVVVAVQPFVPLIAVTVYVPAAVIVAGLAAFDKAPPFHTIVFPALVPVNVALAEVQLMLLLLTAVTVGGVVFDVTATVVVAVQPFVPFVAVTVYVPAAVTVAGLAALDKLPPFQTIVLPALVPVNVALVVVQLILLLLTAVTVGGVVLEVTATVVVAVQPFVPFVAVTVYVPAAITVAGLAALDKAPPFHTIVLPALVPVNVALVEVQLILLLLTAVTVGGVVLLVTTTFAVLKHPVEVLVTVTV